MATKPGLIPRACASGGSLSRTIQRSLTDRVGERSAVWIGPGGQLLGPPLFEAAWAGSTITVSASTSMATREGRLNIPASLYAAIAHSSLTEDEGCCPSSSLVFRPSSSVRKSGYDDCFWRQASYSARAA